MQLNFRAKFEENSKILFVTVSILLATLLFAFFAFSYLQQEDNAEAGILSFYALNVGQGDSFVFFLPNGEKVLIDAGTEEGGSKVVSFLKKYGVKKIDLLVATHGHSDHIGGMKKVMQNFEIGRVWDSGFNHGSSIQRNFYKTIKKKNIAFGRPKRGYREELGEVLFEVIAPAKIILNSKSDTNNNCLVLKVTYKEISFLLTADMEVAQRRSIQPLPQATVLKAAHHGSYNGTDSRLLREVNPSAVILSYGRNNSYGYPHKRVVKDIKKFGAARFDTVNGNIKIETDGRNIKIFGKQVQ